MNIVAKKRKYSLNFKNCIRIITHKILLKVWTEESPLDILRFTTFFFCIHTSAICGKVLRWYQTCNCSNFFDFVFLTHHSICWVRESSKICFKPQKCQLSKTSPTGGWSPPVLFCFATLEGLSYLSN